jgi:hypothetical protein
VHHDDEGMHGASSSHLAPSTGPSPALVDTTVPGARIMEGSVGVEGPAAGAAVRHTYTRTTGVTGQEAQHTRTADAGKGMCMRILTPH